MRRVIVPTLVLFWFLANPCKAQQTRESGQRASDGENSAADSRSFAELFTKLERSWIQAVQDKDEPSLDAILAPEFMLRTAWNSDNPVPRTAWMKHTLTNSEVRSYTQRPMAIRAFMAVAIVSFVESYRETIDGKSHTCDYFIVDVWEVNHQKWQVAARYVNPTDKASCQGQ